MKNAPTSPVNPAGKLSKISALLTRTTKQFIRWMSHHEIDLLIFFTLTGGAILFVMAMRLIADVA